MIHLAGCLWCSKVYSSLESLRVLPPPVSIGTKIPSSGAQSQKASTSQTYGVQLGPRRVSHLYQVAVSLHLDIYNSSPQVVILYPFPANLPLRGGVYLIISWLEIGY